MIAVIIPAPAQIPAPDPATVITGALVSAVAVIPLLSVVGGLALILTRWVSDQHTPVPAPARRRLLLAVSAWGAATVVSTCIATQNGFSTPGGVLLAALALWSVYASARTGYLLCAARQENQGLLHLQGAPGNPVLLRCPTPSSSRCVPLQGSRGHAARDGSPDADSHLR